MESGESQRGFSAVGADVIAFISLWATKLWSVAVVLCGECLCVQLFVGVFAQVCTQIHLWVFAFQFFVLSVSTWPLAKMSFLQGKSADGEEY